LKLETGGPMAVLILNEEKVHLGGGHWANSSQGVNDEIIKLGLELILDTTNHPVLITCTSHLTGTLIGCLRRLQQWNLTSILSEYRMFAGIRSRLYMSAQYIELFDTDLVSLPPPTMLPVWLLACQEAVADEANKKMENVAGLVPNLSR